jgi:hypothetical protein
MRLIQLGFVPADYSESVKGDWKNLRWWNKARKANQAIYVNAGKVGRAVEGFSDNVWLNIFDKNKGYGNAMRDVLV